MQPAAQARRGGGTRDVRFCTCVIGATVKPDAPPSFGRNAAHHARRNARRRGFMSAVDSAGTLARTTTTLLAAAALATGLAAGVAGWRYWHDVGSSLATVRPLAVARAEPDGDLFRVAEGDERRSAADPLAFERQFPLIAVLPALEAAPVLPRPTLSRAHRECGPRCAAPAALVPVALAPPALALLVPPRRPEELRVGTPLPSARGTIAEADAALAGSAPERVRVLGLPLLPFAPVGQAVMRHVADLGETLGAPVADLIEAVR
jgi:hypothetical protein